LSHGPIKRVIIASFSIKVKPKVLYFFKILINLSNCAILEPFIRITVDG